MKEQLAQFMLAQKLEKDGVEKMLLFPISVVESEYDWRDAYSQKMNLHKKNKWKPIKNFFGTREEIIDLYISFIQNYPNYYSKPFDLIKNK